jgi:hypothetical protein
MNKNNLTLESLEHDHYESLKKLSNTHPSLIYNLSALHSTSEIETTITVLKAIMKNKV